MPLSTFAKGATKFCLLFNLLFLSQISRSQSAQPPNDQNSPAHHNQSHQPGSYPPTPQSPPGKLTVEKIMQDPKWIGTSPSDPYWSRDGKYLFFNWNPEKA